jgi:broad specificity phosphatase PhoE
MIYLIRHGQSAFNAAYEGHGDPMLWDARLTAKGIGQAILAAEDVAALDLELVVTSPLTRAMQTTEHLFEGRRPVAIVPGIREWQQHSCDVGRAPSVLQTEFPDWDFSHLEEQWWHLAEPNDFGVPVEPKNIFKARVEATISDIADIDARAIGVVCHGHVIEALTGEHPDNCGIVQYLS